jgi:hypothetical protein
VPPAAARRILTEVTTRVPVALKYEMGELAKRHTARTKAARVHLAAEARFMNVLEHIIVPEMLVRLSK